MLYQMKLTSFKRTKICTSSFGTLKKAQDQVQMKLKREEEEEKKSQTNPKK